MKRKKCEHEAGCGTRPVFANRSEKCGRFCKKKHKQHGMVDVKNKQCEFERGCNSQPVFANRSEKRGRF